MLQKKKIYLYINIILYATKDFLDVLIKIIYETYFGIIIFIIITININY